MRLIFRILFLAGLIASQASVSRELGLDVVNSDFENGIEGWFPYLNSLSLVPQISWDGQTGQPAGSLRIAAEPNGILDGARSTCLAVDPIYDHYRLVVDVIESTGAGGCGIFLQANSAPGCSGEDFILGGSGSFQRNPQDVWFEISTLDDLSSVPSFRVLLFERGVSGQCNFDNIRLFGVISDPEPVPTLRYWSGFLLVALIMVIGMWSVRAFCLRR